MASQITHTQSSNIHPTYTHNCGCTNIHPTAQLYSTSCLIFSSSFFFTVYPNCTMHATASHPSPVDNPSKRRRAVQTNAMKSKNGPVKNSIICICRTVLYSFLSLSYCQQPPPSSLCCPRPTSRHPSNLTSVYQLTALYIYI